MTASTDHPEARNQKLEARNPQIVAFVCKWCTYAGADLAGTSRMTYPSNVRTIMLPCTGRIDVSFVLRAFLQGADGVIVSGCHPGDCHYTAGNYRARRRWTLFRDLLNTLGVDLRRLELAWISAAEGAKWAQTITVFTERIRELGPYKAMHELAAQRTAPLAPPSEDPELETGNRTLDTGHSALDPQLAATVAEWLASGQVKAVLGWLPSPTLRKPRPAWITKAEDVAQLVPPANTANIARLLLRPQLKNLTPLGIIARPHELAAVNVLIQETQIDPKQIVVFSIDGSGQFLGALDAPAATAKLLSSWPSDRPIGFSDATLARLDTLLAKSPEERWQFWAQQSAKCLKCHACRQVCPMCSCTQCFTDKNQPQWFPTAADGPGNFAWHALRAFHLAGRCVGCGACQAACPAEIPLNLLSAGMARSALTHFAYRAGTDPQVPPLQSDYRADDQEDFIR